MPGETQRTTGAATRPKGTANEARWSEIVVAAAEVFHEKGFVAATMQDVASRVGLLAGSLYYYVATKEDLLFAVAEQAHSRSIEWLSADPQASGGDAAERMAGLIARWLDPAAGTASHPMPAERDLAYLRPEQRRRIVAMRNRIGDFVGAIVRQGIDEGTFDAAVDPGTAVNTVIHLLISTERWHRPSSASGWRDLAEWCTVFVVRGLGAAVPDAPSPAGARPARRASRHGS